jgi:hypothetical protein
MISASSTAHVGSPPLLRLVEWPAEDDWGSTDQRRRREAMEEDQLRALLRDLDALKQRPDDAASIERVPSRSRPLPVSLRFHSCPEF